MKRMTFVYLMGLVAIIASGCSTSGLSLRERGSFSYTNFIYSSLEQTDGVDTPARGLTRPMTIAVAQIGEQSPSREFIQVLDKFPYLVSRVEPLPLMHDMDPHGRSESPRDKAYFKEQLHTMRQLAQKIDAEYLFIYGGSADYGVSSSRWQWLDLTLIGAYIIPTNKLSAIGKASGMLVDVRTGEVKLVVVVEEESATRSPTMLVHGRQTENLLTLRRSLERQLAENFINKLAKIE